MSEKSQAQIEYGKELGITLCPKCNCMTKCIVSEDGTHYQCGKCGGIK